MYPRRFLRRSVITAIVSSIFLLSLLAIYQNRHVIFSDDSQTHYHQKYDYDADFNQHLSDNQKGHDDFNLKYATKIIQNLLSNAKHRQEQEEMKTSSTTSQPALSPQILHNHQETKTTDIVKQNLLSQYRTEELKVIDTKILQRFVHLDLKGAAPKVDYYQKLFPYLKQLGANGLLIEYEDMFPFTGHLSVLRHGLAYSVNDIRQILELAKASNLSVAPLLQVYGHLEYVLKLKEFMHLREDKRYPQVITPCLEESYKLLFEMIDQLLLQHPSISYLHIGCDEVYYRLVHPKCVELNFRDETDLFIRHVIRVAKYIKSKRPQIKLFIWHDMLSQLVNMGYNNQTTELIGLVTPMVWAYVDDIKTWFDDSFWMKFSMFPEVWVASSYKGSSGEITTMSYIGHHQRNQQTWLEAMHIASKNYKVNFTGIAVTGWSRYDHMLSLCEFLPSSIPSLAYTLQTIEHGRLTSQLNDTISRTVLGCTQMPLWERSLYPIFISCTFPGHEMYEIMYKYDSIVRQYEETMSFVRLYVTDIHVLQSYIHFKRGEECLERLIPLESQMVHFIDAFQNACLVFFTADIGPEWLQTYFMHMVNDVQLRINFIQRSLTTQSSWPQRPLPKDLSRIVVKTQSIIKTNNLVKES